MRGRGAIAGRRRIRCRGTAGEVSTICQYAFADEVLTSSLTVSAMRQHWRNLYHNSTFAEESKTQKVSESKATRMSRVG